MKENNEKSFKAVEPKKANALPKEPEAKPSGLVAKRSFSQSRGDYRWAVEAGQDCSSLDDDKLQILKTHGVI